MKLIQKIAFLSITLISINTISASKPDTLKNAFSKAYAKMSAYHEALTGEYYSTQKIIWEGKIGIHNVKVLHDVKTGWNGVSYEKAVSLWEQHKTMFEKLLPSISGERDIKVHMCAQNGGWSVRSRWARKDYALEVKDLTFTIGSDIETATQAENEFSLAHEISHAILRHSQREDREVDYCNTPSYKLENAINAVSRKHEQEADLHAVQMLGCAEGGITFFKKLNTPLNRLNDTIVENTVMRLLGNDRTHPTHAQRLAYLTEWQQSETVRARVRNMWSA